MTTATKPRCAARTGTIHDDWGLERPRWCHQEVGLRWFLDADGVDRPYCAAPHHRASVERQYGVTPYGDAELANATETERRAMWGDR
jgi:hypothetical protein